MDPPHSPSPAPPSYANPDNPDDNFTTAEFNNFDLNEEIPPTDLNVWEDILRHRYHDEELEVSEPSY
jgi:hypothetical protein